MNVADVFVGSVSIALGAVGILVAALNSDSPYRLAKIGWIERIAGRKVARIVYAVVGVGLIGLGTAIALGFRST